VAFELDHLFICVSKGAPEAGRLIEFGLTEGPPNTHPGQGTANRRFFFQDGMIELLWLEDEREAKSDLVAPTGLFERLRYRETGASPFGLVFRPDGQAEPGLPFDCWEYRPPYLPEGMSFYIGKNSTAVEEPFLAYIPYRVGAEAYRARLAPYLNHPIGFQNITRVTLSAPETQSRSSILSAVELDRVSLAPVDESPIEIEFDFGKKGRRTDFRPELPLVFRW
jgi:hypothetical protein